MSRGIDPIEKKPFFHFLPGSRAYSIATVGCNLRCSFCQNWTVSQWPKDHLPRTLDEHGGREPTELVCPQLAAAAEAVVGEEVTPDEIVERAVASGCRSIAYTYTEPTVFYELAHDTAVRARARGLKNVFVTNGFTSEAPLREIAKVLDAVNVDLKFFAPESYRRISRARLEPILDAIRLYRALGVWVEVTTLVIPGVNRRTASCAGSRSSSAPWARRCRGMSRRSIRRTRCSTSPPRRSGPCTAPRASAAPPASATCTRGTSPAGTES